jgi:hypothetical protein
MGSSLLKLIGVLLMAAGAFAAIALPGADANAAFEWWGWLYIVGAVALGWLMFMAGSRR